MEFFTGGIMLKVKKFQTWDPYGFGILDQRGVIGFAAGIKVSNINNLGKEAFSFAHDL